MRIFAIFLTIAGFYFVTGAQAQVACSDDTENLVANCSFDNWADGTPPPPGWTTMTSGSTNRITSPTRTGPYSLGFLGGSGDAIALSDCITSGLAANTAIEFGAFFSEALSGSVSCVVEADIFEADATCSGTPLTFSSGAALTTSEFEMIASASPDTLAPQSAQLRLRCDLSGGGSVIMDDSFLGAGLTVPVELTTFSVE